MQATSSTSGGALVPDGSRPHALGVSSDESRRRKVRLALLFAGPALLAVASGVGTALSPTLLIDDPLVLIALNPVTRHLVLVSAKVGYWPFLVVAVLRMFAADPFMYAIGREHGDRAVDFMVKRSGRWGRVVLWSERLFRRASIPALCILPGPIFSMLAGVVKMKPAVFVATNITGTIVAVTVVWFFGSAVSEWIDVITTWVAGHKLELTLGTIVLVVVSVLIRQRRIRLEARRSLEDVAG